MKVEVIKEFGRSVYRKIRFHKDSEFWMYFTLCVLVLALIVLVALEII